MNIKDYLSEIGKRGGQKTKATRDPDYYRRIGKAGAAKRWGKKPTKEGYDQTG